MSEGLANYEITAALPGDEPELLELARHLNTVNLPHDKGYIEGLLEHSAQSFGGKLKSPERCRYVFLLRDCATRVAVGTSSIVGRKGRRDAPYIYFDVIDEEKYSLALDRHFHHKVLRLGFSYQGPTEIAGLVVDPRYRRRDAHLGLAISAVRFLYIARQRPWFQDELLAELLPPLESDGTSLLWEALGRHFTGMSYLEADRLSSENKSFIRDLFPSGGIYATVLSEQAQGVIGKVGDQTRGVEKLLTRIGFRHAGRIDPFDGGPHLVARTDEVRHVRNTRWGVAEPVSESLNGGADVRVKASILARLSGKPPYFLAVLTRRGVQATESESEGEESGTVRLQVPSASLEQLGGKSGDELVYLPLMK